MRLIDAFENWENDNKPLVISQYGASDSVALAESWADYTDALCKDGELSSLQYHYCPPFDESMPDDDHDFILENMGVSFSAIRIRERPDNTGDWDAEASHWRVLIQRGSHSLETFYSMGSAHTGMPQLPDVFNCLLMDSDSVEGNDFESWADDMGLDTDSRKAEKAFNACQKILLDLRRLFTAGELEELSGLFCDY